MAVFTHGITEADIIQQYPSQDALSISETSRGLNFGDLRHWRDQGAGILNAILSRHGIDPEDLGDDERELVRSGVIAYVIGSALRRSQKLELSREYMSEWKDTRKTLSERPQDLGASQNAMNQIITNVPDASSDTASRYKWSSNFGGW